MVEMVTPARSQVLICAVWSAISGHVDCNDERSASSGNQSAASAAHCSLLKVGPPGTRPAASAGATYLRTVFGSTPSELLSSTIFFPACQCSRISATSITFIVLLATFLLVRTTRRSFLDRRPEQGIPARRKQGNYVTADTSSGH